jgi:hypothetical protein
LTANSCVPANSQRNGGYTAFECSTRSSLFYTKRESLGIWEFPLQGGAEQLFVPDGGGTREFAVVRDGIYYLAPLNLDGSRSVRFHSFVMGKEQDVARLNIEAAQEGLTVSPDAHTILLPRPFAMKAMSWWRAGSDKRQATAACL